MSIDARARTVFVVHGRDTVAKLALEDLLRAFDLRVMTWEMAAAAAGGGAPYTGDIVNAGMDGAHAVVVLLTPDDIAYLRTELRHPDDGRHETEPTGQPRMNVLFEAGLAMSRGRDRVVLVEVGSVRPMSDIAGVNTIRIDGSVESLRRLGERLRATGLPVDMDNERWRSVGPFSADKRRDASAGLPPAAAASHGDRQAQEVNASRRAQPNALGGAGAGEPRSTAGKAGAYQTFWRLFLDRAHARQPGLTRATTRDGRNWLVLESRNVGRFVVSFAAGGRLRSELYIDRGDAALNAATFAALLANRELIEASFGEPLSWEELPDRRACRIAAYSRGDVVADDRHVEYADWFIESATRLRAAIDPWLRDA